MESKPQAEEEILWALWVETESRYDTRVLRELFESGSESSNYFTTIFFFEYYVYSYNIISCNKNYNSVSADPDRPEFLEYAYNGELPGM